ncbi:hypothetical protein HY480_05095 [Candidatus Uhrbacteria bacterium]|nr:hypothetical protein [Candidatus Uhrbacteria bacterium]
MPDEQIEDALRAQTPEPRAVQQSEDRRIASVREFLSQAPPEVHEILQAPLDATAAGTLDDRRMTRSWGDPLSREEFRAALALEGAARMFHGLLTDERIPSGDMPSIRIAMKGTLRRSHGLDMISEAYAAITPGDAAVIQSPEHALTVWRAIVRTSNTALLPFVHMYGLAVARTRDALVITRARTRAPYRR